MRKPVVNVTPRLLALAQAATYLGMSKATLLRMVETGEIKAVRRHGPRSRWMFDKAELDRWIEANQVAC